MYRETLTLENALKLEQEGKIVIYNNINNNILSYIKDWRNNWEQLRKKYKNIPSNKLINFAGFDYLIEYKFIEIDTPTTINWVYMYGHDMSTRVKLDQFHSKGQYVYILTNIAYPNMVKIGKAVNPQNRIRQINNAGVVVEWELRWSLPVSNDYKVENLIHDDLVHLRMSSYQNSSREFFNISFEDAINRILYLAEDFIVGEPIVY